MSETSAERETFGFIEGARGLAAVQVVSLHYCSAFLPAFARVGSISHFPFEMVLRKTPVFFLINGNAAVFVFFLMSGFVLAPSFMNTGLGAPRQLLKRYSRLFIPIAVSMLLAIALVYSLPHENEWAFGLTHSQWAADLYANPMTLGSLAKDVLLNSMLLGYQGGSIFEHVGAVVRISPLQSLGISVNPPLWTLHAEFWGSVMTLGVATIYRSIPKKAFWMLFVIAMLVTGTSHFTLFLLGFAAYVCRESIFRRAGAVAAFIGIALIVTGVIVGSCLGPQWFDALLLTATKFTLLQAASSGRLQNEIAAVLLLGGVMLNASTRAFLSARLPLWLGKISFSLYLIHFPILFTVGLTLFSAIEQHTGYGVPFVLTTIATGALTLVLAAIFEKVVDRRAVLFSRKISARRSAASSVALVG